MVRHASKYLHFLRPIVVIILIIVVTVISTVTNFITSFPAVFPLFSPSFMAINVIIILFRDTCSRSLSSLSLLQSQQHC